MNNFTFLPSKHWYVFNLKNYSFLLSCFFFIFLINSSSIYSQVVTDFNSNGTFTVPAEISVIKVEAWGGGGAGGGASAIVGLLSGYGGGGGGGGAYNSAMFLVNAGEQYAITVGSGGVTNGANGSNSTIIGTGGSLSANGGNGGGNGNVVLNIFLIYTQGLGGAGGAGGLYNGGTGRPSIVAASGAGGAGAGNSSIGGNATGTTGGTGGTGSYPGGNGANSVTSSSIGLNGSFPGGGGSGARIAGVSILETKSGGHGGDGYVRITAYRCYSGYATTWNGATWDNGTPTKARTAIINANYNTTTNGSITACSCQINSGKTLTITPSSNLEIYNEIINNGTVEVANNATLVQWYSSVANAGTVKVLRNAKPMKRYDFTYWSSPVTGQNLHDLSPITLFNKYYSWTPSSGWTIHNYGAVTMEVGKGYIVRAPQNFPISTVNPIDFTGIFEGAPNNGTVTVPGFEGSNTTEVWNLIGNPYPSAVDIDSFLTDPDNTEVGGTIYLWTHNTPPIDGGAGTYAYTAHDYASYNLSGGVGTAPAQLDPEDPETSDNNYNNLTDGYVASGQSFFIRGLKQYEDLGAPLNPITVKFKNSMRVASNNTNFFKPGPSTPVENWATTGKHRLWLNLSNTEGAFNQALIGYVENATNGLDRLYDGELFGGNFVTIYSLLDQDKLTIQGKALPFSNEDIVSLGYKTTIAGTFNISLDHFDGLFEGQDVFLKDNLLNVIHNLKEGAYSFASAIGTFDSRFEIVYQNVTLSAENPQINPESILVYKKTNSAIVVNAGALNLDEVKVYDIAGRLLYHQNKINATETFIKNLPTTQQVLVVDVLTTDGFKTAKKIIF